ncbi:MAG: HEAT repeat domain-containing protein [Candidatus Lokiarchaeota archaeon]|nr:HEAT repeat domain-containing protein [Candidatus Lokiarchaeota archaeon]
MMKEIDTELIKNLKSKDKSTLLDAIEDLGDLEDKKCTPYLLNLLDDNLNDDEIIDSVIWSLNRCAEINDLLKLLEIKNDLVILNAIDAIGRRAEKIDSSKLLPFLKSEKSEIRAITTWTLGRICADETRQEIRDILDTDPDSEVRANAAWSLQKFGVKEDISFLEQIMSKEKDELVLYKLTDAIQALETKTNISEGEEITYNCSNFTHLCNEISKNNINIKDNYIEIDIIEAKNCEVGSVCKIKIKKIA